ncbi:nSTAND1 domain-containing NTPase [Nonomuraea sp. NPDC003754]
MTTRLLPDDPDRLGGYWLAGRLGSCFDAYDRGGRRYVIKMARGRAPVVAPHCVARVVESGPGYVVSEFVEGPSLREAVAHAGPYAGEALHRIAVALATALVAIHDAGAVHLHLGPGCLRLGSEGPRVTGVGTADAQRPTPEVFTGGAAGPPADVFSWGAAVLFAATGRDPFAAESLGELMHAVLTVDPDVSDLPEPLRSLAARALSKEPGDRPTARELLIGLTGSAEPAVGAHLAAEIRPPEGLTGPPALGDVAERVYQSLPPEQQSTLPEILLRMREPGRLPLAEVGDDPAVAALTEAGLLVRRSIAVPPADRPEGRLVAVADDSVGPASQALFHAWPRLRTWAEDVTPFRRRRHRRRMLVAGLAAAVAVALAATVVTVTDGLSRHRQAGTSDLAGAAHDPSRDAAGEPSRGTSGDGSSDAAHESAREVAARAESLRSADPMTAMKLSVAAWTLAPVPEARDALQRSLGQSDLDTFSDPEPVAGTAYRLADDGTSLLGRRNDRLRRWDLATRKLAGEYRLPVPADGWTALSGDGRFYAAGDDEAVRVWDLTTGAPVRGTWPGGRPALYARGGLLGVTTGHRTRLYSTEGGPPLLDVTQATVATSPDGRWAAVSAASGRVQVWDLTRRARLYTHAGEPLVGAADVELPPVTAFSPDGRRLMIGGTLLDTTTGTVKARLADRERDVGGWWGPQSFSPDGRFLLEPLEPGELEPGPAAWTGPVSDQPSQPPPETSQTWPEQEFGQTVRLWRLSDGHLLGTYPAEKAAGEFAFSADGRAIRYTVEGGTVHSIDVSDVLADAPRRQETIALSAGRRFFAGAPPQRLLSPDGSVAAVQRGQRTDLHDTATGELMGGLPVAGELSFDGTARLLAVGGQDTTVWDVASRTQVLAIPTGPVDDVALSADGRRLAISAAGELRIWSVPEGEPVMGPLATIARPLVFSPDGRRLFAGRDLVDLPSGKVTELGGSTFAGAFAPDGRTAAFVIDADFFAVWRLSTWPPQTVRRAVPGASIRFSPDGTLLALGGDHTTLWDATTLREISRVPLGQDIADVAFSADGARLIGLREDGTVRESPVDPALAAKAVCAKAGGALDEAGWRRLFPGRPYPAGMCS